MGNDLDPRVRHHDNRIAAGFVKTRLAPAVHVHPGVVVFATIGMREQDCAACSDPCTIRNQFLAGPIRVFDLHLRDELGHTHRRGEFRIP